jgi:transposase
VVWQAKLTEKGLLRPSFIPPPEIRVLRNYTRLRADVTRDRTRYWQRLEKLLEDALIKVTAVASKITSVSVRDMVQALIDGRRDPNVLAGLARGRMRSKHPALVEALNGQFDDHHAELAQMLLDQIDEATAKIDKLTARIDELLDPILAKHTVREATEPGDGHHPDEGRPRTETVTHPPALTPLQRLDEIPGVGPHIAEVILAEIGLDMSRFPTPEHLVSWARLSPRTVQSGSRTKPGKTGKGNPYLKGVLGEAAAATTRTDTFLGERYRRLVKRRGKGKALVAVARSILVIVWHLLADPTSRFHDLGSSYHTTRIDKNRRTRHLINQLEALGLTVTVTPTAAAAA